MAKINLGDIFEIKTSKGYAYIHNLYKDESMGNLVRVLSGLYSERPVSFDVLANQAEEFMVFFPLLFAERKKIVECVGNYSVDRFKKPKFMRAEYSVKEKFLGWHIIDVETWKRQLVNVLTPEQKKLSPWGVWNDTLLVDNLENDWSLENWN
jgi:hypothetical protein